MQVNTGEYTFVAEARGHRVLWFRRFGSYQGEWLMLSRDDELYYVWKDWYGSCSGCDALEAAGLEGLVDADNPEIVKFIADYKPFLEMTPAGALEIAKRDNNLLTVLPGNRREYLDDLDNESVGRQLALVVKHEEGEIAPLEILELDNLELRREAVEKYGIAAWCFDTEAEIVDEEGPNRLMRIVRDGGEPYCFLDLKDGSTDRRYVLRVAPVHRTVHAARAESFGIPPEEFVLEIET